jgi:phosphatidylserine/phosphatidylglycerophosphate/cardiolipin synthase-like enzyme
MPHSLRHSLARPSLSTLPALCGLSAAALLAGCQTRTYNTDLKTSAATAAVCQQPVRVADYVGNAVACYGGKRGVKGSGGSLDTQRGLAPWSPCNAIRYYSHASSEEFGYDDAFNTIAGHDYYEPGTAATLVAHALSGADEPHPLLQGHPALGSPLHKGMVEVIQSAHKTLFLDIMLFGGAWGTEIVREMMKQRKNNPGLEILFLRDNVNVFGFSSELDPLWDALRQFDKASNSAVSTEGIVTALDSDLDTKKPQGIPGGFGHLTGRLSRMKWAKELMDKHLPRLHVEGKSDHSKIIIADAFTQTPTLWVASKNPTDNNLLNYDEGMVIRGPAASLAQIAFTPDIELALKQAQKKAERSSDPSVRAKLPTLQSTAMVESWIRGAKDMADPAKNHRAFAPPSFRQNVLVRTAENNGTDSVRNIEHTLLQLIRGAKSSVRLYNMLAYNPSVAEAFVDAIGRLGADNVRMIVDQALTFTPNLIFHYMVEKAVEKRLKEVNVSPEKKARLEAWDASFRWRIGLKAKHFDKDANASKGSSANAYTRIDIDQQQHAKTVLIDEDTIFLGSANFDLVTFGGSFREFSVAARTQEEGPARAQVSRAKAVFDAIWQNPAEAVSTTEIRRINKDKIPADFTLDIAREFLNGEQMARKGLDAMAVPAGKDAEECR